MTIATLVLDDERACPFPPSGLLTVPADISLSGGEPKRPPWSPGDIVDVVTGEGRVAVRVRDLQIVHGHAASAFATRAPATLPCGGFMWLVNVDRM